LNGGYITCLHLAWINKSNTSSVILANKTGSYSNFCVYSILTVHFAILVYWFYLQWTIIMVWTMRINIQVMYFPLCTKRGKVQEKEKTTQSYKNSIRLRLEYFIFSFIQERLRRRKTNKRTDEKENEITIKDEIEKSR